MSDPVSELEMPKTAQVMARIRSSIVSGQYSPGYRLPTFVEMEGDFAVGRAVIQQALAELKRDGFIRSEGRRGLFVTENPPHLYQYALVLPSLPGDPGNSQLMVALQNEAMRIEKSDPQRRFRFYFGICPNSDSAESIDQLRDDIQNHRLAGLIIHHDSAAVLESIAPVLSGIPRVYLWADETSTNMSPALTVDGTQLLRRALEYLKNDGRQRIALVQMGGTNIDVDFQKLFDEASLEWHAPWTQWVGRSHPAVAEGLVSLLMDGRAERRPDAIIVTDDNLVPYVGSSLISNGIKVGKELRLVAHCNWPWPPPSVLPMTRIGFDVREVLERAINTISQQQEGIAPERCHRIPAKFEWEHKNGGN